MKRLWLILGITILGSIVLMRWPAPIKTRRLDVSAEAISAAGLDLIRIGHHTEQLGLEDARCGLFAEGIYLKHNFPLDPKKGRWFFTLGVKPKTVVISGNMIEIQCTHVPPGNENEIYIFAVQGAIPRDPQIYITP